MLMVVFTPFRYRDVIGVSKHALITGFTTGSVFVVLPLLVNSCKKLFETQGLKDKEKEGASDVILPIAFIFPTVGKLLVLLFVLFGAWFYGHDLALTEYPLFVSSGLFSLFGSVDVARDIDFQSEVEGPLAEFDSEETDAPAMVTSWRRTTCDQALMYREQQQELVDRYRGEFIFMVKPRSACGRALPPLSLRSPALKRRLT